MWQAASIWGVVVAFLCAGFFNAIGTAKARRDFVRWGYPAWWCRITGGLEIATAILTVLPGTRDIGIALGAMIVAVAAATVSRRKDFAHLSPLALFAALLAAAVC
jgi:hypothetical protein